MARKRKKRKSSFAIQSLFEKQLTYFDEQGQPIAKRKGKRTKPAYSPSQPKLL